MIIMLLIAMSILGAFLSSEGEPHDDYNIADRGIPIGGCAIYVQGPEEADGSQRKVSREIKCGYVVHRGNRILAPPVGLYFSL
jgi:hypothetical protein